MAQYLTTLAKILSSQVGVGHKGGSAIKEMYFPDVQYEYVVDGITYQSNRFWSEKMQINKADKIQALVAQYPVGTQVTVYYDPNNPADAFLQKI